MITAIKRFKYVICVVIMVIEILLTDDIRKIITSNVY